MMLRNFSTALPAALAGAALISFASEVETAGVSADAGLRDRIRGMVEVVEEVPLSLIVEALSGHVVHPWRGEERDRLERVAAEVLRSINAGGVTARRVNEAGNRVESFVDAALREHGFDAGIPAGPSGRARSAGYPDLLASLGSHHFYIEVKTFNAAAASSTQRSFYVSPSRDFKVTRDAFHLLIGVELSADGDVYTARSVRWLDLSGLKCRLKYEFNASNRDLYDSESALVLIRDTDERDAAGAVSGR